MEKFHISFEIDTKTAENLDGSIATHKNAHCNGSCS